jgi:hypothetical protein
MFSMTDKPKPFPSHVELMLRCPLYAAFPISGGEAESEVWALEFFDGKLDCFCIDCEKESVFAREGLVLPTASLLSITTPIPRGAQIPRGQVQNYLEARNRLDSQFFASTRAFELVLHCTRNNAHKLRFHFEVRNGHLIKVGQFPSIADLSVSELRPYFKILGKEQYQELTRAVGLVAHGVGIGAFVYLRRIFERLIEQARKEASESGRWSDAGFERKRMVEKIESLKEFVPPFLVENKNLYGILSKGLHDLSEQECLEYFEPVKTSIILVLDQKLAAQERGRKEAEAKKNIRKISERVS